MNLQTKHLVKTSLNRSFCDFGVTEFSKGYLLQMADGDEDSLLECLKEWFLSGTLTNIKDLREASRTEICIRVEHPIEWE